MILILALFASLAAGQTADLVVENARIYTGNSRAPRASFLAISESKIIHAGDPAPHLIGPRTRRIDARGGTIVPGFIDSHAHLAGLGAPVNPLGDLFKTQVWALARHLGVPQVIVEKPASADLIAGQTDEGDFGISYRQADRILNWLLSGYRPEELVARGFAADEVERVRRRVAGTHWKRRLPAVAMVSPTAIGEAYLRPVDY
jgi:hypothetical protein